MTEADEIAEAAHSSPRVAPFTGTTFAEAVTYVRDVLGMADQGMQVIDNTAEALCRRYQVAWFAPGAGA
jgi:hypothetical protein